MPQESEPVVGDGAVGDAPPPPDDGILASRIDWRTAFNREHTETDWIVPGLVEAGRAVALYSPAKAGKSLFLLWLAARVALGQDIFGQPVKARTVLYVDLENTQGDVLDRMEHMGFDADTEALAERLHYLSLPMMRRLDTPEGGRQITEAALAVGADLVVIDTAARTITTAEKDADTWHNWYSNTGFPLKHHGIAVIRLDHSGKDEKKGQRGSSAKNSDVDLVVRLTATQDGAGDAVFLKAEESRQAHYLTRAKLRRGRDDCGFLTHDVESLEWPAGSIDPGVQAVMDQLDGLDVPVTAGRGTVLAALKAAGLKYPKRVVEQAIRVRKEATR
ncbi:MAG: AAA family ATPase [Candidatus Nanopelagicales bacterium]